MSKFTKLIATMLLSTTSLGLISCGGGDTSSAKKDDKSDEKTKITGDVTYACPEGQVETTESMVKEFNKVYPNVKVTVEGYPGFDVDTYMSTKGASGEMPDVVEGYQAMTFHLSQGWVKPLNEFVENDPEFKYVADEILDNVIDGKIYALPSKLTLNGVIVNKDLLNQLNIDIPEYTWTMDEFVNMAKKGTNSNYSGIEEFAEYEREFLNMFTKDAGEYGYNPKTESFDFTSGGFAKTFNFRKEVSSVPGLVASTLKNNKLREEGKEDDYQKKFGKEGKGFIDGKILFYVGGLWNLDTINPQFEYDFYPVPHDPEVGYKQIVHVDNIYMTPSVKPENEQAAFELLKWVTYGVDGTLSKLKLREEMENPIPRVMVPSTSHPDVIKYYTGLSSVPNGVKYMFENIDKSSKGDYFKVVPNMQQIVWNIMNPQMSQIIKGEVDPASIATELESKCNEKLKEYKDSFKKSMDEHYSSK